MRTSRIAIGLAVALTVACGDAARVTAASSSAAVGTSWATLYPDGAQLVTVAGLKPREVAYRVASADGQLLGWVLRTDTIPPVVRAYHGQIGIVVCLTADRQIIDVRVTTTRETPEYFARIRKAFFTQFNGHSLDTPFTNIDSVAQATISADAIIRDVEQSCRTFLSRINANPEPVGTPDSHIPPRQDR